MVRRLGAEAGHRATLTRPSLDGDRAVLQRSPRREPIPSRSMRGSLDLIRSFDKDAGCGLLSLPVVTWGNGEVGAVGARRQRGRFLPGLTKGVLRVPTCLFSALQSRYRRCLPLLRDFGWGL